MAASQSIVDSMKALRKRPDLILLGLGRAPKSDPFVVGRFSCERILSSSFHREATTEFVMPKGKLTPEGEVIAAYGAAMVASF
jgi:hypothetical protein